MQNRKAMKYFSGNVIQRLPLYKVAMGGVAILLCAGIGASAMAAAFIGSPQTAQPKPEAVNISTAETATPTPAPTPDPTATPDKPVYSQVSVIQQDIGVELFYLADQKEDKTTAQAIDVQTADADTVEAADGLLPLIGVAMDITITDEEGTSPPTRWTRTPAPFWRRMWSRAITPSPSRRWKGSACRRPPR